LSLPKDIDAPPRLYDLIRQCWHANPLERPSFIEICERLELV
jgi:Protein tyrosine and serine/threonine kinase